MCSESKDDVRDLLRKSWACVQTVIEGGAIRFSGCIIEGGAISFVGYIIDNPQPCCLFVSSNDTIMR